MRRFLDGKSRTTVSVFLGSLTGRHDRFQFLPSRSCVDSRFSGRTCGLFCASSSRGFEGVRDLGTSGFKTSGCLTGEVFLSGLTNLSRVSGLGSRDGGAKCRLLGFFRKGATLSVCSL